MFNKKLKFEVSVSHRSGAVAALEGPKDVTEYSVRVGCDRLDEWRSVVCSLKGQNETAEITLLNIVDTSSHGEVAKFAELSWFHRTAKQSKLAEQWEDARWVGKLKRADEHLFVIRSLTRSLGAGRRQGA